MPIVFSELRGLGFQQNAVRFLDSLTVGASGVRDFETVPFHIRTEPSRLFIKHYF
jgi:hypothetical protein